MEKPILFSTAMIKAILNGKKTQTRRIIKPEDLWRFGCHFGRNLECRFGKTGTILWVRETFIDLQKTPVVGSGSEKYEGLKYWYRADNTREKEVAGIYKPSYFMPKKACRIRLEITDIWAERLQDISEEDAIAEGSLIGYEDRDGGIFESYRKGFKDLWDSLKIKHATWESNPLVYVIEFKLVKP